jgi:hypothetical protein
MNDGELSDALSKFVGLDTLEKKGSRVNWEN